MIVQGFDIIIDHSLAFLKDDFTELWVITQSIAKENPQFSFSQMIEATKHVLSYLITHHNLKLVDETTEKLRALSETEILSIVENNLSRLKRLPDIGDGVWMTIQEGQLAEQ